MKKNKFLIIGFSGTGNTKMVYEAFKRKIESMNGEITLFEIDRYETKNRELWIEMMNRADYIGLAYPVYGANLPPIFDKFLDELRNLHFNKEVFVMSTVGYINAYGPFLLKKRLKKIGLKLRWHTVVKVFNNTKYKAVDSNKMKAINRKINKKTDELIEGIMGDNSFLKGIGPWLIGGYIVRKVLRKPIMMHYKAFHVDMSLCSRCMLCVNDCPTSAIQFYNDRFEFTEQCTTCLRCKNRCPVGAIKDNKVNY